MTKSVEPGSVLDDDGGWTPSNPSTPRNPFDGSPLKLTFSDTVKLTSMLFSRSGRGPPQVKFALKVKPAGSNQFEPVTNRNGNPRIFSGRFGEDILLPRRIKPADEVLVYPLRPLNNPPVYLTPFGCEHTGE